MHKRPPRIPILSLFIPVQAIPSHFFIDNLGLPDLPTNNLHPPLLSPTCVTCPAITIIDLSSGLHLVRNVDHKHPRYIKYKLDKFEIQIVPHRKQFISVIKSRHLTLRLLMSYIYGAPIIDVSRSHATTHHSR